jgi:hypothetical protein
MRRYVFALAAVLQVLPIAAQTKGAAGPQIVYAQFVTSTALKQLPLVWSPYPIKLIDAMVTDLR